MSTKSTAKKAETKSAAPEAAPSPADQMAAREVERRSNDEAEFKTVSEALDALEDAAFNFHRKASSRRYQRIADLYVTHVRRMRDNHQMVMAQTESSGETN